MSRLFLSLPPLLIVLFALGEVTAPASLQQRNSEALSTKGGVGDITGQYEIPDAKWPEWAHPYPKPGCADGLAFSAGRGKPPSLRRVFQVLANGEAVPAASVTVAWNV